MKKGLALSLTCALAAGALQAATVFVEAEAFSNKGGWVVDQQFMDQMGSPFLLAHGLGKPVQDAETKVTIPADGEYRILARTRNWLLPKWSMAEAPGRFQVCIDGKALPKTLGTKGEKWLWHEAGTVNLKQGDITLTLHDLTGFDGRCDAIILTTERTEFPSGGAALEKLRYDMGAITKPGESQKFDLVIAGGGIPGVCAAISAARLGLTVALINDRPVLGGNNSSEVRVHLGGRVNLGPYPKLGDVLNEIGPAKGGNAMPEATYEDARKYKAVAAEKNIKLFLNTRVFAVEKDGAKIKSVVGRDIETGRETRFEAPLFLDNTGDGTVGALAGAEFRYGRESKAQTGEKSALAKADRQTMGSSVQWYTKPTADKSAVPFPDIPWAMPFTDKTCEKVTMGEWTWETGMNLDQITQFEEVRDYGMFVVFSNWCFLKNRLSAPENEKFAPCDLKWVAYVAGKRESRRIIGDYILTETDLIDRVKHPDGTCFTTWTIDLHYPDPKNTTNFPGREFKSIAKHQKIYGYPIPYRCLYSKDVPNLFLAGRNISVTHIALGTIRLMRTGGMMGEVVGMAAKLCKDNNCMPREIYKSHLDDLKELMDKGVGDGKKHPPQTYNMGGMMTDAKTK